MATEVTPWPRPGEPSWRLEPRWREIPLPLLDARRRFTSYEHAEAWAKKLLHKTGREVDIVRCDDGCSEDEIFPGSQIEEEDALVTEIERLRAKLAEKRDDLREKLRHAKRGDHEPDDGGADARRGVSPTGADVAPAGVVPHHRDSSRPRTFADVQLRSLERDRDELRVRLAEVVRERDDLREKLAGCEADRDELAAELVDIEAERDELRPELTAVRGERDRLARHLASANNVLLVASALAEAVIGGNADARVLASGLAERLVAYQGGGQ